MSNLWGKAIGCAHAGMLLCGLTGAAAADAPLTISWRLVENLPDNRFRAVLTLHNQSPSALSTNWHIYFNCSARLLPASLTDDTVLTHINGDFYSLQPAKDSSPIEPGEKRIVGFEGSPWAINVSDAPSGFYVILRDDAGKSGAPRPLPLEIESFPAAEKIKRGAADIVPVASAEMRYRRNESLTLLPADSLPKVVPTPITTKQLTGHVALSPSTSIDFDAALANEGTFLTASLERFIGQTLKKTQASSPERNKIRLRLRERKAPTATHSYDDEAYTLTIHPENGVDIVGSGPAGVFYGVQSLLALIPVDAHRNPLGEVRLDAAHIEDAPRFPYRGLHLDVARNFQSKETVKKLLDLMAFYKLNRLHWHLTDDEGWRIEVKALPELTQVGAHRGHTLDEREQLIPSLGSGPSPDPASSPGSGFYTQDDIVDILRYANARHIKVIPELDFPGHARAAVKSMQARQRRLMESGDAAAADEFLLTEPGDVSKYESVQMWRDNVVDVGRDATYRFLDVVVGELSAMYRRAGLELTELHLGGDEVPAGAWQDSPACARISTDANSSVSRNGQLQLHFLTKASEILAAHDIRPACWEDCLLMALPGPEAPTVRDSRDVLMINKRTIAYVWNNVWGWGREDAAYRLANAGYDVVLSNATSLYFDLAYEKHPAEIGYYWAGFVDARAPFELNPLDVFKNADRNSMGQPVDAESLSGRARLTDKGKRHITGIQGQLWSENLRSAAALEYMAFPKLISLAERAWAQSPEWADVEDADRRNELLENHWNQFANQLGQRELPRLDYFHDGVQYRLPPPGTVVKDRKVLANVEYPGLTIRYATGDDEPTADSKIYQRPIPVGDSVNLRAFDTRGRGSRTVTIEP